MQGEKHPIAKQVEALEKAGANILIPFSEIDGLSDIHKAVIDKVYLSANPNDGDVYPQKGQKDSLILSYQGLMRLSMCAGIIWHPYETRRTDPRNDKLYVSFQAVGGIRKSDGTISFVSGHYDLDFEIIEEELRDQYWQTAKTNDKHKNKSEARQSEFVDFCVRRDMIFKRKHKMKLAESGAKARVIKALLGVKKSYTMKELKNPFVVVRVTIQPDLNDPKVKEQLTQISIQAITGIYGPNMAPAQITHYEEPPLDINPEEIEEIEPDYLDEFKSADKASRIAMVKRLFTTKNLKPGDKIYEDNWVGVRLQEFDAKNLDILYSRLVNLPDKASAPAA